MLASLAFIECPRSRAGALGNIHTSPMVEPFIIESAVGSAKLVLRAYDTQYFVAVLYVRGLEASAPVCSYLSEGFGDFFADLARCWKGWTGVKEWTSLEGELVLRAECDRTGHVELFVHLHDGAPARWTVESVLVMEAGQLDRIAADARAFQAAGIHVA